MLSLGFVALVVSPLGAPEPADDAFDVHCGRVLGELHEVGLVVGRGDAGERPHLRVAQPARGERLRDERQVVDRAGDPELLPSSATVEAALPTEPLRARPAAPLLVALAAVVLAHEQQPPALTGRELPGQLRELRLDALERHLAAHFPDLDGRHLASSS